MCMSHVAYVHVHVRVHVHVHRTSTSNYHCIGIERGTLLDDPAARSLIDGQGSHSMLQDATL